MDNFKKKINDGWFSIKKSLFEMQVLDDESSRAGRRMGKFMFAGLTLMGIAVLLLTKGVQLHNDSKYASVETTYGKAMSKIDGLKNGQNIIFVLHRTGCQACENAEKTIATTTHDVQSKRNEKVVVIDLAKLNKKETAEVAQTVPTVLVDGKIPSPATVKLTKVDGRVVTTDSVVGDNNDKIETLIESEK